MVVEMCTIIFQLGIYSYLRLPIGMSGSADIFQAKMMDLMEAQEYCTFDINLPSCQEVADGTQHSDKILNN